MMLNMTMYHDVEYDDISNTTAEETIFTSLQSPEKQLDKNLLNK